MKQRQHAGVGGAIFHATVGRKWCAGPTVEHVLRAIQKDHDEGKGALVNYLGEHCKTKEEVMHNMEAYETLIERLATFLSSSELLDPTFVPAISMKPTQFGLDVAGLSTPENYTAGNMSHIVALASRKGIPVWMDMEGSDTTDFTIGLYKRLLEVQGRLVRLVLQANLKRTPDDLRDLMQRDQATVRLVKGIYPESPGIAFMKNEEIHRAFAELIEIAFTQSSSSFGVAIGSHHSERIAEAVAFQQGDFQKDYFVVQMLRGVMKKLADQLVTQGVPIEIYEPYGPNEFPYSVRRMRESPSFILGLVRATLFEGRYTKLYEHHQPTESSQ
ncbi:Proline dehydrogenase [Candidatus Bilamarchaeum dharawalense]|uniref:Proline dehydrogenase n=1 Tax=Candidatus Bilamarchaeum dharawalense TaxID=2885759 RepID=A0A5E4LST6_9ARCH|nr:Proline dehydrogenase [Candidatus Bilamarchaeum dharawalense]